MFKIFYVLKVCVQLAVIGCSFRGLCSIVTTYMLDLCTKRKNSLKNDCTKPI
jgi:hypothetical protein